MHHTYDPNMTHDDETDLLSQLKTKHEMLKQNRERRRRHTVVSNEHESNTDHESRRGSVLSDHAGKDNLAFVSETDGEEDDDAGGAVKLQDMNTNNRQRRAAVGQRPNGIVIEDIQESNENQNNSHTARGNGYIPNRDLPKRSVSFEDEIPEVRVIPSSRDGYPGPIAKNEQEETDMESTHL